MPGTRNRSLAALALLGLAACATVTAPGDGIEPDPVVRDAVAATAQAVAGRDVAVVVHVGHVLRAELRPDGRIHVWRGLLLRTRDADELAFVLAHELAHEALGHPFPARGKARDIDQELAADARARDALQAKGFDPNKGAALLRAVRDEASSMATDAVALVELDRRISAFGAFDESPGLRAVEPWHHVWRDRWRTWLAADPASLDPQRRALVERRAAELH